MVLQLYKTSITRHYWLCQASKLIKDRAELPLPPTSSVELVSARLRDLPVGGKTPLGAGLLETYNLIRRVSNKDPHTRFVVVVISDGRANQGMTDLPVKEEVTRCAQLLLELQHTDYLVVDTEDKSGFMRADLAAALAASLGATLGEGAHPRDEPGRSPDRVEGRNLSHIRARSPSQASPIGPEKPVK
jgi:Mg-chelatase subunit ChlD